MAGFTISVSSCAGRTGRGVTVAVVDSGIHAAHPHVLGIAGGIAIDDHGGQWGDVSDRLGHGTAVAGAIREKAPESVLLAVKVFDRSLRTTGRALVDAIRWASSRAALINLSLGTTNAAHEAALTVAIAEATAHGAIVVTPAPQEGARWLPGALTGVIAVEADWNCARDCCDVDVRADGRVRVRASGYPRPIPGLPPAQHFQGPSFAVANVTGLLALMLEESPIRSVVELVSMNT